MAKNNNRSDICYKNNYLSKVVARVDFLSPLLSISDQLPRLISDVIKPNFPIGSPEKLVLQKIPFAGDDDEQMKIAPLTQWSFHDKKKLKHFCISPHYMWIAYDKYESYELLRKEFLDIASVVFDAFKDAQGSRSGLRYINDFELKLKDPFSWDKYINEKMLCLLKLFPYKENTSRIFSNIELSFEEYNIKCKFGLFNPDYPSIIRQNIFKIDLDAYYQGIQDSNDVLEIFDVFHDKIQELFEESITEKMRTVLNGQK